MILRKKNSRLARTLEETCKQACRIESLRARSGNVTYVLKGEGGWDVCLHSRVNPEAEAEKLVSSWDLDGVKTFVLLGFGIGYPLFELSKRIKENQKIIAIEKEIKAFYLSIHNYDWWDILSSSQIDLFIGEEVEEVEAPLGYLDGNSTIFRHEPSFRSSPTYYCKIEKFINEMIGKGVLKDEFRILTFISRRNPITQDITDALIQLGQNVLAIPFTKMDGRDAAKLVLSSVSGFKPHFILTNNTIGLDSSLFEDLELPIVLWQTIESSNWPLPGPDTKNLYIFVPDHFGIKGLKAKGYKKVYYLPLATNPKVFHKMSLNDEDQKRYGCDISFAGACDFSIGYREHKAYFDEFFTQDVIEEIIDRWCGEIHRSIYDLYSEIQQERPYLPGLERAITYLRYIEYEALSRYRKGIIKGLLPFNIRLYGDKGWKKVASRKYCGWIDNRYELPILYNATKINLNVNLPRSAFLDNLNMRSFDIPACGGFMLTNFRHDLLRLFREDEIAYFKNMDELQEKVRFYLENPKERQAIAERGQARVLKEHTFIHRMKEILSVVRESL